MSSCKGENPPQPEGEGPPSFAPSTARTAQPSSWVSVTPTSSPGGVNFTALSNRFSSACLSWSSLPRTTGLSASFVGADPGNLIARGQFRKIESPKNVKGNTAIFSLAKTKGLEQEIRTADGNIATIWCGKQLNGIHRAA